MSSVPVPVPASADRKALMTLGEEQVAVRVDAEGFLRRVLRRVRLQYGTELYCAARNPGPTEKVAPYQPGYMKLVSAMGGQLLCPPMVRDQVTGEPRPNPQVETYPDTGIIRRVTATALCVVPNPSTGEQVASVQTLVLDTEHVLRQALLAKAEHEDIVRILSEGDVADLRAEGGLRGWVVLPLAPPHAYICANMVKAGVREAWSTFLQQSATARQRACSKAERLAADHNPVTRMTWEYGQLRRDTDAEGNVLRAPYVDVSVVAWVEHRGRAEMDRLLQELATVGQAEGVARVFLGDVVVDVGDVGDDLATDPDAEEEDGPRRIEEAAPDLAEEAARPAREPVRTQAPAEAPAAKAAEVEPPAETSPQLAPLRARVARLEEQLGGAKTEVVSALRRRAAIADPQRVGDIPKLRSYQSALADAVAAVS